MSDSKFKRSVMQQIMKLGWAMMDTHQSKRKIDHVERGSRKSNCQSFHLSMGTDSKLNDYWSVFIPSVDHRSIASNLALFTASRLRSIPLIW